MTVGLMSTAEPADAEEFVLETDYDDFGKLYFRPKERPAGDVTLQLVTLELVADPFCESCGHAVLVSGSSSRN